MCLTGIHISKTDSPKYLGDGCTFKIRPDLFWQYYSSKMSMPKHETAAEWKGEVTAQIASIVPNSSYFFNPMAPLPCAMPNASCYIFQGRTWRLSLHSLPRKRFSRHQMSWDLWQQHIRTHAFRCRSHSSHLFGMTYTDFMYFIYFRYVFDSRVSRISRRPVHARLDFANAPEHLYLCTFSATSSTSYNDSCSIACMIQQSLRRMVGNMA